MCQFVRVCLPSREGVSEIQFLPAKKKLLLSYLFGDAALSLQEHSFRAVFIARLISGWCSFMPVPQHYFFYM